MRTDEAHGCLLPHARAQVPVSGAIRGHVKASGFRALWGSGLVREVGDDGLDVVAGKPAPTGRWLRRAVGIWVGAGLPAIGPCHAPSASSLLDYWRILQGTRVADLLSMTQRAADRASHLAARSLVTNGQGHRPQKVTGGSHLCHVVSYTGGAAHGPLGIYDENKSNFPRSAQVST